MIFLLAFLVPLLQPAALVWWIWVVVWVNLLTYSASV
jgi:hypothetical protein